MRKLTYMAVEVKKATFVETSLIRLDIFFVENDLYSILYLEKRKTNMKPTGMQIILVVISKSICPVAPLKSLFIKDLYSANASFSKL